MVLDKKKKMLDKLKMPAKRGMEAEQDKDMAGLDDDADADQGAGDDQDPMGADMYGADDGDKDEALAGKESPEEEQKELEMLPDDVLLAEVKKRGLMAKLKGEDDQGQDDQDQDHQDPYSVMA